MAHAAENLPDPEVPTCHSCGHEAHGYDPRDLMQAPHGWVWHPIPFRDHDYFVMCGGCEKRYCARRAESQPWATDSHAPSRSQRPVLPFWDPEAEAYYGPGG